MNSSTLMMKRDCGELLWNSYSNGCWKYKEPRVKKFRHVKRTKCLIWVMECIIYRGTVIEKLSIWASSKPLIVILEIINLYRIQCYHIMLKGLSLPRISSKGISISTSMFGNHHLHPVFIRLMSLITVSYVTGQ